MRRSDFLRAHGFGMATVFLLLVASACLGLVSSATPNYRRTVSYEGEVLLRCVAVEGKSLQGLLEHDLVDVWAMRGDGSADVRIPRSFFERISAKYPECFVLSDSVEALVQAAEREMVKKNNVTADWFEEYHRYDEIVEWYKTLADANSDVITFNPSIGKSVEGRDQPVVHIGKGPNQIYSQCQIHAREWISGATCMFLVDYLVQNNGKDERVTNLLNEVEFVFIPFTNPDGYEYTWSNSRLWRKNRQKGSLCDGVDLNRNYNDHWGGGGSSGNECSETYRGKSAASEPETKNTQDYFKGLGSIVGAIDWHSYSQLILRPYGWTNTDSPDEAQLKKIGDDMSTAIRSVHGKFYTSQKSIGLYITTGTASDWFYSDDANANNAYRAAGYTIELRDTGSYGFLLPPDQIIPTGEEMVAGFLLFAESLNEAPLSK